jgi:hypothetical protein
LLSTRTEAWEASVAPDWITLGDVTPDLSMFSRAPKACTHADGKGARHHEFAGDIRMRLDRRLYTLIPTDLPQRWFFRSRM